MKITKEQIERMDGLDVQSTMGTIEQAVIDAAYELESEEFNDDLIKQYLMQWFADCINRTIEVKNSVREEAQNED